MPMFDLVLCEYVQSHTLEMYLDALYIISVGTIWMQYRGQGVCTYKTIRGNDGVIPVLAIDCFISYKK